MSAYIITHQGLEHVLRVQVSGPGRYEVSLDGRSVSVDGGARSDNPLSLIIDGRCYEVDVDPSAGGDHQRVTIRRQHFELEMLDEKRKRLARKRSAGASGRQEIRAPMSGSISKLLVAEGDEVSAGQVLMVLDAMKMANELAAPLAGRVSGLNVNPGAAVTTNDLLCVVLPPSTTQPPTGA